MNILIIGEFSAFAKHLKQGFKNLGHSVSIVHSGDGFKNVQGDADDITYKLSNLKLMGVSLRRTHLLRAPFQMYKARKIVSQMPHIDIIIIINYQFVAKNIFHEGILLSEVLRRKREGSKIIMTSCGDEPALHMNHRDGNLKYSEEQYGCPVDKIPVKMSKLYDTLLSEADYVVPVGFSYIDSLRYYTNKYGLTPNITNVIPLPITKQECHISSCKGRKIRIFHGVIREQAKGTKYFREALRMIEMKYPDRVECRIDGKLPYDEYTKLFNDLDILLDQTNGYGLGMNAVLGMMKGKLVFSGNEPENVTALALGSIPVINAKPDVNYLFTELEKLILNPEIIDRMKTEAREFAMRHLESTVIANRYLQLLDK